MTWRRPSPLELGGAVAGLLLFGIVWYYASPSWVIGSHVIVFWDRAGDAFREGGEVYWHATDWESFYYAPPIALILAAVTWLPVQVEYALIVALDVVALRLIGGTWWAAALLAGFPLVPFEIGGGQFNLFVGAAIVLAVMNGPAWPLGIAAWMKLSPVLADPRRVIVPMAIMAVLTAPWWHRWIEWAQLLFAAYGQPVGPQLPIPLLVRLVVAGGLLTLRRPWARAGAAIAALPAVYWESLVLLIVPVAVWWRQRATAEPLAAQSAAPLGSPS